MSAERYRIQRLDQGTELITPTAPTSNVEPFPTKHWNDPLPIAVEGRPVLISDKEDPKEAESKPLTRFYPPLLLLSTALTAAFLFLYMTKPVIIAGDKAAVSEVIAPVAPPVSAEVVAAPVKSEELSPWPEANALSSDVLPGLEPPRQTTVRSPQLIPTTLGVEKIVEVASLNGELEKFTVSVPVLYPENVLAWNESSIAEAHQLTADIEEHLRTVRAAQANGVKLLESWNRLMSKSVPKSVLTEGHATISNP